MTKNELLKSAEMLKQPAEKAAKEFEDKADFFVNELNKLMKEREDVLSLMGNGNISMMEDNHKNHMRFLSSLFFNYQPEALVETVLWVFRAYRSHGFKLSYWPAQLNQWVKLFQEHLSEESYKEVYPFYHWMIINQSTFVLESDKLVLNDDTPEH